MESKYNFFIFDMLHQMTLLLYEGLEDIVLWVCSLSFGIGSKRNRVNIVRLLLALHKTISFVCCEAAYWIYDLIFRKKSDEGDSYNKDYRSSNYIRH